MDYSTKKARVRHLLEQEEHADCGGGRRISGLTAAYDLITKGHQVVLFEAIGDSRDGSAS